MAEQRPNPEGAAASSAVRSAGHSSRRSGLARNPFVNAVAALALVVSVLGAWDIGTAKPAAADVPPVLSTGGSHVTADALPTVQINGVAWDQTIVGNTVYVVGEFTSARPAGAARGTNETPRSNILAYNLTTGELITSFAPVVNNMIRVVKAAPDGSRIYIGGTFTNVSGINQYRVSALDPVTGAVDTTFSAVVDYRVNALAVTDTTVYVGGRFGTASSYSAPPSAPVSRSNLAAFNRINGSVLPWNPGADSEVLALVTGVGNSRVFAGGKFKKVGGSTNLGLAAIDAQSGSVIPWAVNQVVQNSGNEASILSLSTDGNAIYGTGYHFGSGGNLEGTFSADPITGEINFVQACHGDTYDAAPIGGYVYSVSHVHFCGNIGGFPQSDPWGTNGRYALAFTTEATGTSRREPWGYFNWQGTPAPSIVDWFPDFTAGTYTGLAEAGWTVEGNDDYVIVGGEFPTVNGMAQEGLVRFARAGIAPSKQGPRLGGANFPFNAQSDAAGQVRVSFPANVDRDDLSLTYRFIRDGDNANPIYETTADSTPWDRSVIGFTDKGLTPGSTHTYSINSVDKDGNSAWSDTKSVQVATSGTAGGYADAVMADGPRLHWRFNETSGASTAAAGTGIQTGSSGGGVSFGTTGAITNDSTNRAASFSNNINSHVTGDYTPAVDTFSVEAWVKTTSNQGGRIMGYSSSKHGQSSSYDRHLYMNKNGSVTFGVYPGTTKTVSSNSGLNNGQWHHVVGTVGGDGMHLYIDGVIAAANTGSDYTGGQGFYGYWRVGADMIGSWPGSHNDWLATVIDEPAVYYQVLSPARVAAHYAASGRTPGLPPAPSDSYGAAMRNSDPTFYYRLSESSGNTANDSGIGANNGTYVGTVGRAASGAVPGNTAATFSGSGFVRSPSFYDPTHYSAQAWFNTSTTSGGQIIGFGEASTGLSTKADRQIYMKNGGQVAFATGNNGETSISSANTYNDGAWHYAVATQGADGMQLYVDGVLVATGNRSVGAVYAGYWRIGGDNTNGGSTNGYFNGRIDEAAVHDRVLTAAEVLTTFQSAGGEVPNIPPTAAFTATSDFLNVIVDGSGSSDSDGTIASYSWDFGDSTPAKAGVTAQHAYATAGTYHVTLTVTDNKGATGTTTHDVTVAAEPANVPPVASFTVAKSGLNISTDAGASIDPDGSIVSYAWNFGDSTTGTGVSASHAYANPGPYTVKLTVTDNKGATDTTSQQVEIEAPTGPVVYASDTFGRTIGAGFGNADVGGAWSLLGPNSWYKVADGVGSHVLDVAGRTTASTLNDVSATDVTVAVDLAINKPLTGSGLFSYLKVRATSTGDYQVRVRAETTKTTLTLFRTQNGTTTILGNTTLNSLVLTPGSVYRLSLSAEGTSPTTLSAKIWDNSGTEPVAPQATVTDNTSSLQGPGAVGMTNYLTGSATNAPVAVSYDNLLVANGDGEIPDLPNVAPTASFTGSITDQTISLDASGSSDSDGTITAYNWNFGDSNTGTGKVTSHTYAVAGPYTVTLTVTDDDGATSSSVLNITIQDPGGPVLNASDTFTRTVSNAWGTADLGGAWGLLGMPSLYQVANGVGSQILNVPGRTTETRLADVSLTDVSATVDLSIDKPLTGSGLFSYVAVRQIGSSDYNLRVRAQSGSTELTISRKVNGAYTVLGSKSLSGVVLLPGETYRVNLTATGSGATTLSTKLWKKSDGEPLLPDLTVTDNSAPLQAPGGIGLSNYLSGSTTNAPLTVGYDNVEVGAP